MRITFGKYYIEHDGKKENPCVTLYKEKILGEKSHTPGESAIKIVGYYPSMITALDRLLEEEIWNADVISVKELITVITEAKQEITSKIDELKQAVINSKKGKS
jgi:hypothetical protein